MQRNVTEMSDAELDTEHESLLAAIIEFDKTLDWSMPFDSPPWVAANAANNRRLAVSNEQWFRHQVKTLDSAKVEALLAVAKQPRLSDEVASALRNAGMIKTMTDRDGTAVHIITPLGRRALGI